jgi:hypothetical protein
MLGRSRRPPFDACLNHSDHPRINPLKVYGYARSMSNAATIAANRMVHDTGAKLLKCPAINLSQIDPTTAADLTFAAAAARYSTSECQIQNFSRIILRERDADGRAGGV